MQTTTSKSNGNGNGKLQYAPGTVLVLGADGIAIPVGTVPTPPKGMQPAISAAPASAPTEKREAAPPGDCPDGSCSIKPPRKPRKARKPPRAEHGDDGHDCDSIRAARVPKDGEHAILQVRCSCGRIGDYVVNVADIDPEAVDWDP